MKKDKTFKTFSKYVSLNVMGMVGLSCYILADTYFISNSLGTNGLSALNFSIAVYSFIHGIGLMLGIGGATRYSILIARNKTDKANSVFSHSVLTGIIIGIVLVVIGVFLSEPIARLLGADETTVGMTKTYLTTILCFSPFFILNNILLAFVRNDKSPNLSMIAMLLGSLSNVVLDYIFIFPMSMGMFGAAFATGLAPVISIIILSSHFIRHKNKFKMVKCKFNFNQIKDISGLGLSAFITEVASGIVLIIFNLIILRIEGNVGVAAYAVVANISLVVVAIFTGIAQGIQPLASKGHGKNDKELLKKILRYAVILSTVSAIAIYIVTYAFSDNIIKLFNSENNETLISLARNGFHLYFIGFLFAGFNIIISAFLSAVDMARRAFIISITRGCGAIIPVVFILSAIFGMNGVWLSFVIAEFITAVIGLFSLRAGRK